MFKRPAVVPLVECPSCKQLLEYGVEYCSRCREKIDSDYALISAVVVHHNTQACSLANTIKGADSFVIIALIGTPLIFVIDIYAFGSLTIFPLILIWPVIPLLTIIVWFYRFGRFKLGDEEYGQAKRDMRSSLLLWGAILAVQLIIVLAWW